MFNMYYCIFCYSGSPDVVDCLFRCISLYVVTESDCLVPTVTEFILYHANVKFSIQTTSTIC